MAAKENKTFTKTITRGPTRLPTDALFRQFFVARSAVNKNIGHKPACRKPEKIIINNNINIKIDYYQPSEKPAEAISPASRVLAAEHWRRAEYSSNVKKEKVPPPVQLSLSHASSP